MALQSIAGFLLLLIAPAVHAQAVWEDYQGNSGIAGSSGQDLPGPNYGNNVSTSAQRMTNLRTIAANPANASRTGTATTIDFTNASQTLCNLTADTAGTGAACQADAQGRVLYVLLRLPLAGNYSFSVAHDDEVDIDLSADYANATSYRTLSYTIPVSSLSSFTAGDTTYENVSTGLVASAPGRCAVMRVYWNNAGGVNFLRMRWTRPDSVTETIPASALLDPRVAANSGSCTGAITVSTSSPSVTVNKVVGATGRRSALDQFTVGIATGGVTQASATTSGTGTGQQASTGSLVATTGTTYTISDVMAAGSANPISLYTQTIACTRNSVAFTPGGTAGAWTVSPTAGGQAIVCTVTNTRIEPVVAASADSATLVAHTAATAIANVAANDTVNGGSATLGTGGNATVAVSGTWPAGFTLDPATGAILLDNTVSPGTYALPYLLCDRSAPPVCQTATATIVTTPLADLVMAKSNGLTGVTSGQTVPYTLTVTNNGPDPVTGAVVTDSVVSGLTCAATNAVAVSGPGAPSGSFTFANLTSGGITLGTLAAGQSVVLSYNCAVN